MTTHDYIDDTDLETYFDPHAEMVSRELEGE